MLVLVMLLTLVRVGVGAIAMVMVMLIGPLLLAVQKILAFIVFPFSRVDQGFVFFSMGLWVHARAVSKVDRQAVRQRASTERPPSKAHSPHIHVAFA